LKDLETEQYYMIKIKKNKAEFVKVTNGNEDFINKQEYNFSALDESNLGLYKFEVQ